MLITRRYMLVLLGGMHTWKSVCSALQPSSTYSTLVKVIGRDIRLDLLRAVADASAHT